MSIEQAQLLIGVAVLCEDLEELRTVLREKRVDDWIQRRADRALQHANTLGDVANGLFVSPTREPENTHSTYEHVSAKEMNVPLRVYEQQ